MVEPTGSSSTIWTGISCTAGAALAGLPGQFQGPHAMTVDQDGNLYTAEVFAGRVQKFRPKPGADPARLVGQEVRLSGSD